MVDENQIGNRTAKLCKEANAEIDTSVIPVDVTNTKEKVVNRLLECTVGCFKIEPLRVEYSLK